MVKMLKNWYKKAQQARKRRIALQELRSLTDRELQDLGLNRCELYSKVYGIN